jgi:putative endonuclease
VTTQRELGIRGERLAAEYLEALGYTVLSRNYRWGRREVDLIVRLGRVVAFVEVKTRAGDGFGHPLEAITALKRREVERVAIHWQRRNGRARQQYRFDAVGVLLRRGARPIIEHVPNAWRLGE